MEKLKKIPITLNRRHADLLLITTFFVAAILITIVFKINENAAFHQQLTNR